MYNLKDLKMYVTLAKTGFLLFEKFDFFIKNDGKSHINQGFQICHIYLLSSQAIFCLSLNMLFYLKPAIEYRHLSDIH